MGATGSAELEAGCFSPLFSAELEAGEVLGTWTVSEGACVRQAITTAMQTVDENAFPARSRVKQRCFFAYRLNAGKSSCQMP